MKKKEEIIFQYICSQILIAIYQLYYCSLQHNDFLNETTSLAIIS